jgi:Arc/MetJ family transcription regulator
MEHESGDQLKLVRTTIDIDDALMKRAMRVSGESTKRATVQRALELLVLFGDRERLLSSARRQLSWEGDLATMRRDSRPRR